jgi:hypothetical protein
MKNLQAGMEVRCIETTQWESFTAGTWYTLQAGNADGLHVKSGSSRWPFVEGDTSDIKHFDLDNARWPEGTEAPKTEFNNVTKPAHYADTKIEVIDYIEDKDFGYHLGNAVKYISRAGKKDPAKTIEDLEKAVWCINRKIETLKKA